MSDNPGPAAAFLRIALLAGVTACTLVLVGYWPTAAQAGPAGVRAMLVAVAIALAGAWAGSVPTVAYLSKPAQQHMTGILLGLSVRFVVTIGLTLAIWMSNAFPERPLLLWVGIAQFVILGVDVYGLRSLLRRTVKEAS